MKVEGTGNIARRNLIMDNHHDAFTSEVGSWQRYSRDARIYNNTIYNNGGAAWRIRYYQNETRPSGNEFKNNLVYRNRQTPSNGVNNTNDSDIWMYMTESGADAPADNRVINNLVAKSAAGDGRVYLDPPVSARSADRCRTTISKPNPRQHPSSADLRGVATARVPRLRIGGS